jgi:hypothetical protein
MGQRLTSGFSFINFSNKDNQEGDDLSDSCESIYKTQEEIDALTKQDLVKYITSHDFKKLEVNDVFFKTIKSLDLESENIIPLEIEIYNYLTKELKEMDYKSSKIKSKYRNFTKPKFEQKEYIDYITKKEASKSTDLKELSFNIDIPEIKEGLKWENITLAEYMAAFKDDKSTTDMIGISKLMLAELSEYNKQKIINIYNNVFSKDNNLEIINNYAIGKNSFIYKGNGQNKGPDTDIQSFRQITSIPITINHMHRIIALRLHNYINTNNIIDTNIQKGGVGNLVNPIYQQVIKLKNTIKHASKKKNECCILFVDFNNAFPSMNISRVIEILKKYNIDKNYTDYIELFYKNLEYYTDTKDWTTDLHKWNSGLLQGCPMSPILFVVTLNYILKYLDNKYQNYGYKYSDDVSLLLLGYLDDITIITKNYSNMMEIFKELSTLCAEFGLTINMKKTQYMHINPSGIVIKDTTETGGDIKEEVVINKVEKYKYLGHHIYSNVHTDKAFYQFYYQVKYRLEKIEKYEKLSKKDKAALIKLLITNIQQKFTILYDVPVNYKKRLVCLVKKYITKLDLDTEKTFENLEIQLIPDMNKFIQATNDKILKNIEIEDCIQITDNIEGEDFDNVININDIEFKYTSDAAKNKLEEIITSEDSDSDSD